MPVAYKWSFAVENVDRGVANDTLVLILLIIDLHRRASRDRLSPHLYPFYFLDQLVLENLSLSLVLMPLAPLGVALGHWLVRRSEPGFYYRAISVFLVVLGAILIIRSLSGQTH